MGTTKLTTGALSARTGCNIETIRYYERIGILPAAPRTQGGHRVYRDEHLRRLTFVRRSRELGFSLEQIRELLQLVDGGDYTCGEIKQLALRHHEEVRAKVADLNRMAKVLRELAAKCVSDEVPDCPIIDALFRQSA